MGKRFTATEKWTDRWFRALSPSHKLGWLYLLDNCDSAGVIDLDRELADFQIGMAVDWDSLLIAMGNRVTAVKKGKLMLTGFLNYQYGNLSEECRAHNHVFACLDRHGLRSMLSDSYAIAMPYLMDKEQDKDKDKEEEQDKDKEASPRKRFSPPTVAEVADYCQERGNAVDPGAFVDFYESKNWMVGKTRMANWKAAVRNWERNNNDSRGSPISDPRGNIGVLAGFISKGKTNGEP